MFEKKAKAKTYLVCDGDALDAGRGIVILGYFAIALKVLHIPEDMPNRRRRELDGFAAKIGGIPIQDIPCYLIGQIARDARVSREVLSGAELVEDALRVIMAAVEAVGGRFAMIECHNHKKLLRFYHDNAFVEVGHACDGTVPMVQMLRKLVD
ncbi:MAG: hypothetical protein RSA12_08515 [Clostridia bacterium]